MYCILQNGRSLLSREQIQNNGVSTQGIVVCTECLHTVEPVFKTTCVKRLPFQTVDRETDSRSKGQGFIYHNCYSYGEVSGKPHIRYCLCFRRSDGYLVEHKIVSECQFLNRFICLVKFHSKYFNCNTDNILHFHVNFQQHSVAFIRLLPQYCGSSLMKATECCWKFTWKCKILSVLQLKYLLCSIWVAQAAGIFALYVHCSLPFLIRLFFKIAFHASGKWWQAEYGCLNWKILDSYQTWNSVHLSVHWSFQFFLW